MPQIINTNIASLNAQRNLNKSQSANQTSLQRLSSGLRINSAKDDAAGLAISTRFNSQIRGLNVAVRNAGDGISLAQTAEGALGSMNDNLQRVRELAVQSANATNSDVDRDALQSEVSQLLAEVSRTADETDFNGRKLLDGSFSATFQIGANAGQTLDVSIAELTADKLGSSSSAGISARGTDTGIQNGDLVINGTAIDASRAGDDTSSTDNASASAISKVAAINRASDETGVVAQVNTNVVAGATQVAAATTGSITLNDVEIDLATGGVDAASDRKAVVAAINAKSEQTGITAIDTDDAATGIRLEAADGRNVEISFGGTVTSAATGIAGGDAGLGGTFEGGFTLTSKLGGEITVQSGTGDLANTGMVEGTYAGGVASVATAQRTSDSAEIDEQAQITITDGTVPATFDTTNGGAGRTLDIDLDAEGSAVTITLEENSAQTLDGLVSDINAKIAATSTAALATDNIAGRVEAVSIDNQLVIRATDSADNASGVSSQLDIAGDLLTATNVFAAANLTGVATDNGQDFNSTAAVANLGTFTSVVAGTNDELTISVIGADGVARNDTFTMTADATAGGEVNVIADINAQIATSLDLNGRVLAELNDAGDGIKLSVIGGEAQGTSSILRLSGSAISEDANFAASADPIINDALGVSDGAGEMSFYGVDGLDRSSSAQYVSSDALADGEALVVAGAAGENDTLNLAVDGISVNIQLTAGAAGTYEISDGLAEIRAGIAGSSLAGLIDVGVTFGGEMTFTAIGSAGATSNLSVSGTFHDDFLEGAAGAGANTTSSAVGVDSSVQNIAADALAAGDLVMNDVGIRASRASDDTASDTTANSSDAAASGIAVAAAINEATDQTGVTAVVNKTVVDGGSQTAAAGQQGRVMVNNVATDVISTTGDADTDRASAIAAINGISGQTGVMAVDAGDRIILEAEDGRNISLAIDTQESSASGAISALSGDSIGLSSAANGVTEGDLTGADTFAEVAATTYSSVTLESAKEIRIEGGNNGNVELANAGFEVGDFGGAESGQFLKDVDISTFEGAQEALVAIDNAIGQIASQRADLGAIQNRMESTVSNLAITSENLSAANSRIQDADFAAETAELSRTQVLQQAGISILSQANQGPQQVLSLLG